MFCCPRCSDLSTILNNIVEHESGVTILFNIDFFCVGVMYSGEYDACDASLEGQRFKRHLL